jgi:hypothetical protein
MAAQLIVIEAISIAMADGGKTVKKMNLSCMMSRLRSIHLDLSAGATVHGDSGAGDKLCFGR